jgi:hypothetical protein
MFKITFNILLRVLVVITTFFAMGVLVVGLILTFNKKLLDIADTCFELFEAQFKLNNKRNIRS